MNFDKIFFYAVEYLNIYAYIGVAMAAFFIIAGWLVRHRTKIPMGLLVLGAVALIPFWPQFLYTIFFGEPEDETA